MKRLLVLTHRLDRTGAPLQLLTLLDGLDERLGVEIVLLHAQSGELEGLFDRLGIVRRREARLLRLLRRVEPHAPRPLRRLLRTTWAVAIRSSVGRIDAVYITSLMSHRLAAPFLGLPTVLHVHEFGSMAASLGEEALSMMSSVDRVLVPSRVVADWVVEHGAAPDVVHLQSGAVPDDAFIQAASSAIEELRTDLALRTADFVIVSVGWIGHAKGIDRFLDVADLLATALDGAVRMVWVGAGSQPTTEAVVLREIEVRGLGGIVSVLPRTTDLRPHYAVADVVLLTSREESLSLVALEAAAQGTPVVYFPGSGGPDVLAEEGVIVAPAGHLKADVVELLVSLAREPSKLQAASWRARSAVERYRVERANRQLEAHLRSALFSAQSTGA